MSSTLILTHSESLEFVPWKQQPHHNALDVFVLIVSTKECPSFDSLYFLDFDLFFVSFRIFFFQKRQKLKNSTTPKYFLFRSLSHRSACRSWYICCIKEAQFILRFILSHTQTKIEIFKINDTISPGSIYTNREISN